MQIVVNPKNSRKATSPDAYESRGTELVGARPFDKGLLVFSSTDQFYFHGDDEGVISPNTADMELVNTYTASNKLQPIAIGQNVVFVDDPEESLGSYSQLREYQVERVFGQQVALSITDQIPEYIPTDVFKMVAVSQKSAVVLATSGAPNSLFCYNYYYNNEGKVQSSWQRWDYRFKVLSFVLVGDALYIVATINGRQVVLRQRFSEGVSPLLTEEDILLDQRLSSGALSVSYSNGSSSITLPYRTDAPEGLVAVVSPQNKGNLSVGQVFAADTSSSGNTVVFKGVDLRNETFFLGFTFEFDWELSPVFYRDEKLVVVQDGRLQLSKMSLLFNKSGPFEVHVTPPGRQAYVKKFTGFVVGSGEDVLNSISLSDGEAKFSAPGESDRVVVRVVGRTPWRVRFSSMEWSGKYRPKTRRAR